MAELTAPLDGIVVADLASGIAGGYCTKLLADGGAHVVKLEPADGDPLRRWSAADEPLRPDEDGALFQFLNGAKESVVVDPSDPDDVVMARAVVRNADAVVWSPGTPLADDPQFSPAMLRVLAPHAPVVSITPTGLGGPWSGLPTNEFTLQAWSGGIGQRGTADRPPVQAGGRTGDWVSGMFAAIGLLTAHRRSLETGAGELVDVSSLESIALTHCGYPITYRTMAGRPPRPVRSVNFPGIEKTSDGWVGFMVVTGQQWQDFCIMVGRPEWMERTELILLDNRLWHYDTLGPAISGWMSDHTSEEILELADALRIPASPIGTGATVVDFEHFRARDAFVKNPQSGFLQPAPPYRLSNGAGLRPASPAPRLGADTAKHRSPTIEIRDRVVPATTGYVKLPFEGIRIADFTAFWAGPILGHVCSMLGAEVIHVESTKRPDSIRSLTVKTLADDEWWEWAPMFQGSNTNKLDVTLDIDTERGRELALELIASCDVVAENYSPRVFENWGFTYEQIREKRSDIIMVRMPSYGLDGPWRNRGGYAQTMEQVSGMAWITGYPDQGPQVPNGPCDPIGGSHAMVALLMALEYRRRTGKGMEIESPQVGGALQMTAEQVITYSAYGHLLGRTGNRDPGRVPQGVFRTGDHDMDERGGRFVAISIEDDDQWQALVRAIGEPDWTTNPSLATLAGRRANEDHIEQELGAWVAEHTVDAVISTLWPAGIPVAKVHMWDEQDQLPPLAARGYWEAVPHPVTGANLHGGYPVRFEAGPKAVHRRAAPMLGQDNHDVLSRILGLGDDEIAALAESGVIGTRPLGS